MAVARKKKQGKKYNYMDTYGDLVTLLLCFFVLLFAMSTVEEIQYNAFVEALSQQFSTQPSNPNLSFVTPSESVEAGSDMADVPPTGMTMEADQTLPQNLSQLEQAIEQYVEENNMQGDVSVERNENGTTFIRLSDNLLFDGDSSTLRPQTTEFLDFLAAAFNAVDSEILQTKYNGHTAYIDGSTVDDWILSGQRAATVASYITETGDFDRFKVEPVGYGRNYPIADNAVEEGRAKNRRVDIIVLGNDAGRMEETLMDSMRVYFPSDPVDFFEGGATDVPDAQVDGINPTQQGAQLDTAPVDDAATPDGVTPIA